jgi:short-subunit dehydrogenase
MPQTALVTGASAGIGRDLARIHARHGGDLVIVARRRQALDELKLELERRHSISVRCIAVDLTSPDAVRQVYDEVSRHEIEIDILVNNAGFGGHGKFHERPWEEDKAMIELNVMALCELTHRFLQEMLPRGRGRILNVASTAGFLPGPLQAVYYASKAFVVSFSQALAEELSGSGITVTALCPGPVDTDFIRRADLQGVAMFRNSASSMDVAEFGYRAMQKGKLVAVNDRKLAFTLRWLLPFLPRRTVLRLSRRAMEKSGAS